MGVEIVGFDTKFGGGLFVVVVEAPIPLTGVDGLPPSCPPTRASGVFSPSSGCPVSTTLGLGVDGCSSISSGRDDDEGGGVLGRSDMVARRVRVWLLLSVVV